MMTIEVVCVPVLEDNYVWLVHEEVTGETVVVDPAVADPVLEAAEARGWDIVQIWNTHWHDDHIGGNARIKAITGCTITGPAAEAGKINTLDIGVREGDIATIGGLRVEIWEVPAHTAGHIAYYLPSAGIIFVGDTLFAMGCGRLFEGTAEQMFANMQRLAKLDGATKVYCAHEYTLSNGNFALSVESANTDLKTRMEQVTALRERGLPTVPMTIELERATNPFMRASSAEQLAHLRAGKDRF